MNKIREIYGLQPEDLQSIELCHPLVIELDMKINEALRKKQRPVFSGIGKLTNKRDWVRAFLKAARKMAHSAPNVNVEYDQSTGIAKPRKCCKLASNSPLRKKYWICGYVHPQKME